MAKTEKPIEEFEAEAKSKSQADQTELNALYGDEKAEAVRQRWLHHRPKSTRQRCDEAW